MAIPLGFVTARAMGGPDQVAALLVGGAGALGMAYGIRQGAGSVLKAAAFAVVVAAWYYGVEQAGALGAVAALLFTAAVLFWLSRRVGNDEDHTEEAGGRG